MPKDILNKSTKLNATINVNAKIVISNILCVFGILRRTVTQRKWTQVQARVKIESGVIPYTDGARTYDRMSAITVVKLNILV
jgi:hypothetical protein